MKSTVLTNQKIISYLTFKLGGEYFALNVGKVINILELQRITKIPKSPEYLAGMINLRGEVLPLIDTNIKLGYKETVKTSNTCILVVETETENVRHKFGILVDSVQEVLEFEDHLIKPPPSYGNTYENEILTGVVESDEKLVMVMDIEALLSAQEIISINNISNNLKNKKK